MGPTAIVDMYNRVEIIGGITFRQKSLDSTAANKEKVSIDSYFLAMTTNDDNEEEWVYETGRAEYFFSHIAPTPPTSPTTTTQFIKAMWPEVPKPKRTTRSNLPIILPNVYKTDASYPSLNYMSTVWSCALVVPTTICVCVLDNLHDVPTNITAHDVSNTRLRYYRQRNMTHAPSADYKSATSKAAWNKLMELTTVQKNKHQSWLDHGRHAWSSTRTVGRAEETVGQINGTLPSPSP